MTATTKATDTALRAALTALAVKCRADAAEQREHAKRVEDFSPKSSAAAHGRAIQAVHDAEDIEFLLARYPA